MNLQGMVYIFTKYWFNITKTVTYSGHHGLHIRTQLSKVLAFAYPHISIRVVFRPSCRLSSFFPFKYRIPIALMARNARHACLVQRLLEGYLV
jgi:hypothetical protein